MFFGLCEGEGTVLRNVGQFGVVLVIWLHECADYQIKLLSLIIFATSYIYKLSQFHQHQYHQKQRKLFSTLFKIHRNLYDLNRMILLLLISPIHTLFSQYLHPLTPCLANCLTCQLNALNQCRQSECVNGYYGDECSLEPSLKQIALINRDIQWEHQNTNLCNFKNQQPSTITVLGFYELLDKNEVIIPIQPYYKFITLSFNLIRTSWTPYSDLLKITVKSPSQRLQEFIIDYYVRQQINPETNLIRCGGQPMVSEKFMATISLNQSKINRLIISFEGYIFSGAQWAISNPHLIYGCDNFILYEESECRGCQVGFYPLRVNGFLSKCEICPSACVRCSSVDKCEECVNNFELEDGRCRNQYQTIALPMGDIVKCQNYNIMVNEGTTLRHSFNVGYEHKKLLLLFNLYYTPSQYNTIQLRVDGVKIDEIALLSHAKSFESCDEFGIGYYTVMKVTTQYFLHDQPILHLQLISSSNMTFGISQLHANLQLVENNTTEIGNETMMAGEGSEIGRQLQELAQNVREIEFQINVMYPHIYVKIIYPTQVPKLLYIFGQLKNSTLTPTSYSSGKFYSIVQFTLNSTIINQNLTLIASQSPQHRRLSQVEDLHQLQIGFIEIVRYDAYEEEFIGSFGHIADIFQVVSWITIISTIVLSFVGKNIIMQQFSILLQMIFHHVYIYTQYIPMPLKIALGGLHRIEKLNYLSMETSNRIQAWLLGDIVEESPLRLAQFKTDINFSRAIYPILLIDSILFVFFMSVYALSKWLKSTLTIEEVNIDSVKDKMKLFVIALGERILNFWYCVFQYQFITVVWAAIIQCFNFTYSQQSSPTSITSLIFCIVMLVFALVFPFLMIRYIRRQYDALQYIEYYYWFENIFFFKLPDQSLPSGQHRIWLLLTNMKYVLCLLVFALIGNYPFLCVMCLIGIQVASLVYTQISFVEIDAALKMMNIIEHVLLMIIALMFLIICITSTYVSTVAYQNIGIATLVMILLLISNGLMRVGYLGMKSVVNKDLKESGCEFKLAVGTERVV